MPASGPVAGLDAASFPRPITMPTASRTTHRATDGVESPPVRRPRRRPTVSNLTLPAELPGGRRDNRRLHRSMPRRCH
jgi:hypothetical protein